MKKTLLIATAVMAGCNPMPYKQSCQKPDFTKARDLKVQDTFATWGYFSEQCPSPAPKRFVVPENSASLHIFVDGEWLRLSVRANSGDPLGLRAPNLYRGSDVRVDQLENKRLEVEAIDANGSVIQTFQVPFELQECTCVTYDAL
jgi:hypothetical protein